MPSRLRRGQRITIRRVDPLLALHAPTQRVVFNLQQQFVVAGVTRNVRPPDFRYPVGRIVHILLAGWGGPNVRGQRIVREVPVRIDRNRHLVGGHKVNAVRRQSARLWIASSIVLPHSGHLADGQNRKS